MGFFPFQGKVGGVERVNPNPGDMCLWRDPAGIPQDQQTTAVRYRNIPVQPLGT